MSCCHPLHGTSLESPGRQAGVWAPLGGKAVVAERGSRREKERCVRPLAVSCLPIPLLLQLDADKWWTARARQQRGGEGREGGGDAMQGEKEVCVRPWIGSPQERGEIRIMRISS